LTHLKALTGLHVLNLDRCYEITDKGLAPLGSLIHLRELGLESTKTTDAGLKSLMGLIELRKLDLSRTKVSNAGLVYLKGLTKLQSLDLGGTDVTPEGLKHLKGLKELRTLTLPAGLEEDRPVYFKELTNLEHLQIRGGGVTDAMFVQLKELPKLKTLTLFTTLHGADLTHLAGLRNVRALSFPHSDLCDGDLVHLKKLTNLESLDLGQTQITDEGLKHLKAMTNLQTLRLLSSSEVSDAAIKNLKGLTNLRELDLTGISISDAGLRHLQGLTKLQGLSLRGHFTDAGLKFLKGMTNLQTLNLRSPSITDAGLTHLKGLTNLRSLYLCEAKVLGNGFEHLRGMAGLRELQLCRTRVSEASLKHLAGLAGLETLVISYARIPDRGMEQLCRLKNLKELNVDESKVSDAAVTGFRQARPGVKIIRWTMKQTGGPGGFRADEKPTEGGEDAIREDPKSALVPLVRVLNASNDAALQRDILRGMVEALQGRRQVAAPKGWSAVYKKLAASKDAEVREKALVLSVLFGDPQALADLRKTAADPKADGDARRRALETLVEKRANNLLPLLRDLLADRTMRGPALRGLAAFSDPGTPALILGRYASFSDADKADAVATLASRPAYARALLDAMEKGKVPRRDLSPFVARQILGLGDKELTARLNKVWGSIRQTAKDRAILLARYRALVKPAALKKANRSHGRLVFQRTCASCHTLFDAGGKIGPELTGSQRTNPEYILAKVLDPNAAVARDYQVTRIVTTAGRVVSGIIKEETAQTVTVQTPNEVIRLAKADIDERNQLTVSLMPEGQLGQLSDTEVRDLIAYLAGPSQVPLPKQARSKPDAKR
jgi:putative heme-binding domain-containing protein